MLKWRHHIMSHKNAFRNFWEPYSNVKMRYLMVARKILHHLFEEGVEKSIPRDHRLSSLGKPRDAKQWSSGWNFLYLSYHSDMIDSYILAHLSPKTSCSIGKTQWGISLSHPRDLLIPSTWPAYPIHVTSIYINLGCFQSNSRLNIM